MNLLQALWIIILIGTITIATVYASAWYHESINRNILGTYNISSHLFFPQGSKVIAGTQPDLPQLQHLQQTQPDAYNSLMLALMRNEAPNSQLWGRGLDLATSYAICIIFLLSWHHRRMEEAYTQEDIEDDNQDNPPGFSRSGGS